MARSLIGSFQLMKSLNRSIILNTIRTQGPISRAEIAQITKLTPPTVGNIVKELIDAHIVVESKQGESRGGRKPTLLIINASQFYIIGLDVGPSQIQLIFSNLDGHILNEFRVEIPVEVQAVQLLDLIDQGIDELLNQTNVNHSNIVGIGVGMHGIVDVTKGISLFAPNLQLRNIPIKAHLESRYNMTVKIDNDVRAMALGEEWFGAGKGISSVVCVNVGRGIGAGIIQDGQLFHGHHFIAGEIGHMTIDIDGPLCQCGNYGCLQALASGPAIAAKAAKEIAIGRKSLLTAMIQGDLSKITGELIHEAATQGDELSQEVLRQTGVYLGVGLTNLIHILNPDRIIIGGGVSKAHDFVFQSLRETIAQRALTNSARETEISISALGDKASAIGAATLLLQEIFSS